MGCYEYNPATADSNGDGIPDWWYHGYSLNPTNPIMAMVDSDTDTFDNEAEYVADTVPTNAVSYFKLTDVEQTNSVAITFGCSTARVYSLQSATNLVDGEWLMPLFPCFP